MASPGETSLASLDAMPTEIMEMIAKSQTKDADGKNELILDAKDFGNLRRVNRQIHDKTFDTFAKRFFTFRKHMLSRVGLRALIDISRHPQFRKYVKEVAFGPERILDDVVDHMLRCSYVMEMSVGDRLRWQRNYGEVYQEMVSEQQKAELTIEDSREPSLGQSELSHLLSVALSGFPALNNIRIDTHDDWFYPLEKHWDRAWGMTNTLQALGYEQLDRPVRWMHRSPALVDVRRHYWHHRIVLDAVYRTKELPENVTLGLAILNIPEDDPFNLASPEWKAVKGRVSSITYTGTTAKFRYSPWLTAVLQDCENVTAWTLENQSLFPRDWLHTPWKALKHLTLRRCWLKDDHLQEFLVKHGSTLETITCDTVELTPCNVNPFVRMWPVPPNLPENTSWWRKFEVMLTMPRLKKVVLGTLWFSHAQEAAAPPNSQNKNPDTDDDWLYRHTAGGTDTVTMENGDIAAVLERTLRDKASYFRISDELYVRHVIWFFEAVSAQA